MKYVIILGDGMADIPVDSLCGKTPLETAFKPNTDSLAPHSVIGNVNTVPAGMVPESDTANLAVMGYDPRIYSKGRSPLEAASMGIAMRNDETAIRANIVSLAGEGSYEDLIMADHSSDEIPTEEARTLIDDIQRRFGSDTLHFYCGVSYRHCLIWKNCPDFTDFSRPHDIIGRRIGEYLPASAQSRPMRELMEESYYFLNSHPLNIDRAARGLKKANSLWLWSPGKKPSLPSFTEKTGLKGSVVCAVDLIKGIGFCAGMSVPYVEGATGTLDTDYAAKCAAAINELENGADLVYIHVEAPDECGHRGETENKVKSIEYIDKYIVGGMLEYLRARGEHFRMLILPDHPTPLSVRTHTRAPVPFLLYDSEHDSAGTPSYSEAEGMRGISLERGEMLMDMLTGEHK